MSRLSYATVGEAFILGSEQIKNTQDEIAKLKALILESSITPPSSQGSPIPQELQKEPVYQRIPQPDTTVATFPKETVTLPDPDSFETMLIKLINHPKFDDIVKNYVSIKYPNTSLKETKYEPQSKFGKMDKESFGTICSTINNIISFLIIAIIIYMICSLIIK